MKTCSSPCTVTLDCVGAEEVEAQLAMEGTAQTGYWEHLMSELVSPNRPAGSFIVQCSHITTGIHCLALLSVCIVFGCTSLERA